MTETTAQVPLTCPCGGVKTMTAARPGYRPIVECLADGTHFVSWESDDAANEVHLRRRTPEGRAAYIAGRVHDAEQAVIAAAKRYHEFASKPITDTAEYRLAANRDRPREIAMIEALSTAGQRVSYAVIALLIAETAAQMVAGLDDEEPS